MEEILRWETTKLNREDVVIMENPEFHRAIAKTSENNLVLKVLDGLLYPLSEIEEYALEVEGSSQRPLVSHWRILAAIRRHNVTAAANAMRRHIQEIEETILHEI